MKMHYKIFNEPTNEPIIIKIVVGKKRFSDPKLYIAKETVNGKKIPCVKPGYRWYVWFYWRTDPNGKLDKKIKKYDDINRFKTVAERKAVGKSLCNAYALALSRNWNPTIKDQSNSNKIARKKSSLINALHHAIKIKVGEGRSQTTINGYEHKLKGFITYLSNNNLAGLMPSEFTVEHFYDYLDYLRFEYKKQDGSKLSNNTVDNTKRDISALFTVLKNERFINHNFIKDIPKIKSTPQKNKAFTNTELKTIKEYLQKNDPYLIVVVSFMLYPVLRVKEIMRLQNKDVDLDTMTFGVRTKTEFYTRKRIIKKIEPIFLKMDLNNKPSDFHIVTKFNEPGHWNISLKSKVDHFGNRFRKVLKALGFGKDYTLYSCRHTSIINMYTTLQKEGKNEKQILYELMPITGHKSEAGIKNYLRGILQSIPKDHSHLYTIDF